MTEIGGVTVLRAEAAPHEPDAEPDRRPRRRRAGNRGRPRRCARRRSATMSPATSRLLREAQPAELADWLRDRGLEPGWGWMSFRRGLEPVPRAIDVARPRSRRAAEAQDFGRIVATGYGLPDAVVPWAAQAPSLGWDCWLALDGDEPAAAAGVFISEGVGYLGFAATLPEHRGKGAPERAARGADRARARGGLRRRRHRDRRAPRRPSLQLVPQHPPGRLHRGRRARQLAPASAERRARRTRSRASGAAGSARPSAPGG